MKALSWPQVGLLLGIGLFVYLLAGNSLITVNNTKEGWFNLFALAQPNVPTLYKDIADPTIHYADVYGLEVRATRACAFKERCADNTLQLKINNQVFQSYPGGVCQEGSASADAVGGDLAIDGSVIQGKSVQLTSVCNSITSSTITVLERVECLKDEDCGHTLFAGLARSAGGMCNQQTNTCVYGVAPVSDVPIITTAGYNLLLLILVIALALFIFRRK